MCFLFYCSRLPPKGHSAHTARLSSFCTHTQTETEMFTPQGQFSLTTCRTRGIPPGRRNSWRIVSTAPQSVAYSDSSTRTFESSLSAETTKGEKKSTNGTNTTNGTALKIPPLSKQTKSSHPFQKTGSNSFRVFQAPFQVLEEYSESQDEQTQVQPTGNFILRFITST